MVRELFSAAALFLLCVEVGAAHRDTNLGYKPEYLVRDFNHKCNQEAALPQRNEHARPNLTNHTFDVQDDECMREPSAWRWRYVDETKPNSDILVHEKSIDSRLANIIYTVQSSKILYNDPFKFDSGSPLTDAENERLAAGPEVDDQLCAHHLTSMLDLIDQMATLRRGTGSNATIDERHIRLARVLDSFGRYEAGYLNGRTHSLGSYNQCRNTRLLLDSNQQVDTRFCWARMTASKHLDESLKKRKPLVSLQDPIINVGICIPSSCHTRSFRKHKRLFKRVVGGQFELPDSLYKEKSLELQSIFCTIDEHSQIGVPFSGKLLVALMSIWFTLIIYASLYRHRISSALIRSFDVIDRWAELLGKNKVSTWSGRTDLSTLNLFKVLASTFIVYGHTSMMHYFFVQDQLYAMWQVPNDPWLAVILVGTLSVDTFFVITGILMTTILMNKLQKLDENGKLPSSRTFTTLAYYVQICLSIFTLRYLKLVPVYFLVFWFTKSIFPYLGSGPFWDHGFNKMTSMGACQRESWLTPLTATSAHLPLFRQCLTPSWSISTDLSLSLIVIPLIILAYFRPKLTAFISTVLSMIMLNTVFEHITSLKPALLWELKENSAHGVGLIFGEHSIIYTRPLYRLPAIVLGCMAGFALFKYNRNDIKDWPRWFAGAATPSAIVFCLAVFAVLASVNLIKSLLPRVLFREVFPWIVYLRAIWCAANAILFTRMVSDWQDHPMLSLSKSNAMKILTKISYALMLIHWNVVMFDYQYRQFVYNISKWHFTMDSIAIYSLSIGLSTIVHVAIETPLDHLIGQLFLKRATVNPSVSKEAGAANVIHSNKQKAQ